MPASSSSFIGSVFNLNDRAYCQWREHQQVYAKPTLSDLLVAIKNPLQLSDTEQAAIIQRCEHYNMVIYQLENPDMQEKSLVHALGRQLAMGKLDTNIRADEDSVSSLEVRSQAGNQYIPYTNKALSWHTDGYYNAIDKQIFGIIMHCVRAAATGGVNSLLNPESLYIKLRDENPAYIEALMHKQAMTIPDNIESGKVIRAQQTGPVFIVKPEGGAGAGGLHMRFSARKRNIVWRDTPATKSAVAMINDLLADEANVFNIGLQAGQGIICNNVLHNRSAFSDGDEQMRLMYRARYYGAVHHNK